MIMSSPHERENECWRRVEAPAFMRGKERFSAPGNILDSIRRFSAGNAGAALYGLYRPRKTRCWVGSGFSPDTHISKTIGL
jgi:hypothetical protein